jgi:hypothetical protein
VPLKFSTCFGKYDARDLSASLNCWFLSLKMYVDF